MAHADATLRLNATNPLVNPDSEPVQHASRAEIDVTWVPRPTRSGALSALASDLTLLREGLRDEVNQDGIHEFGSLVDPVRTNHVVW